MAKITKKFLVAELASLKQQLAAAQNQAEQLKHRSAVLSGAIQVLEHLVERATTSSKNNAAEATENEAVESVTENEEEDAPAATDRPPVPDQGPE